MPLFRYKDKVVFFIHIPKTGGSSIEHSLREAGAKRALHYHKRFEYVKCAIQHMHADLHEFFVPSTFYDESFAVVRHPVDRLFSEYRWRLNRQNVRREFDPWIHYHLNKYAENPYILDNHLRPQVEFIGKSTRVFRFEDGLKTPLEAVGRSLTLENVRLNHRNKGSDIVVSMKERTLERINTFYAEDFAQFNYQHEFEYRNIDIQE